MERNYVTVTLATLMCRSNCHDSGDTAALADTRLHGSDMSNDRLNSRFIAASSLVWSRPQDMQRFLFISLISS